MTNELLSVEVRLLHEIALECKVAYEEYDTARKEVVAAKTRWMELADLYYAKLVHITQELTGINNENVPAWLREDVW